MHWGPSTSSERNLPGPHSTHTHVFPAQFQHIKKETDIAFSSRKLPPRDTRNRRYHHWGLHGYDWLQAARWSEHSRILLGPLDKTLRCGPIYHECRLKETTIGGLIAYHKENSKLLGWEQVDVVTGTCRHERSHSNRQSGNTTPKSGQSISERGISCNRNGWNIMSVLSASIFWQSGRPCQQRSACAAEATTHFKPSRGVIRPFTDRPGI